MRVSVGPSLLAAAAALVLGTAAPARAVTVLDTLSLTGDPDVNASFVSANYSATTGALDVLTNALFDQAGDLPGTSSGTVTPDTLAIHAIVDASGIASSGTFSLEDSADGYTVAAENPLLVGTLSGFGAIGQSLNFVFDVTGGLYASAYGPQAGMILAGFDQPGGFFFAGDFSRNNGVGDLSVPAPARAIPEPASALLALAGALLIVKTRAGKPARQAMIEGRFPEDC